MAALTTTPRILGVIVIAGFLGVAGYTLAQAASSPTVTVYQSASHRYFSPDGDGQEDTADIYYCLSESANVTITVTDSGGQGVRTLEDGVSHPGQDSCSGWNNYASWDGKDDGGKVVPDGVYTVHVHAVDAAGQIADDSVQVGVDTRLPGALTTPAPGDSLSGTVKWVFTPATGLGVSQVQVSCNGAYLGSVTTAGADGTFTGSGDTTGCVAGANSLAASAYWADPFGVGHWWSAPAVPVTINNVPQVTVYQSASHRYFSPDGDGQEDTADIYYCLSKDAKVTVTVTDAGGSAVRTIESAAAKTGNTYCPGWNNYASWDGKDDGGKVVPDGVYTVHVHAVDAAGQIADDSVQVGVDTRRPGALTTPAPGDSLSGTVKWVFTPATGLGVSQVQVSCNGAYLGSVTTAGADGTFTGSGDTTGCVAGANSLAASAYWADPFGVGHWWSAPAVPVTINNVPQVTVYQSASHRYFSPDGDGQEDTADIYYCLSKDAKVTVTVTDAGGSAVRTIESAAAKTGNTYCPGWNNYASWDGKDDGGKVVPDGVYTVHVHAVDAAGQIADDSVQVGVDTRLPGALTTPAPGDSLSGTVKWVFTPATGLGVSQVQVSCNGAYLGSVTTAGADGTFTGSGDTTGCVAGANSLAASAYWADPFGVGHWWSAPAVPVTIANPPGLSIPSGTERYFSPNGDGQEDTADIYYCLSKDAKVTVTVTDAGGSAVRTIESAAAKTGYPNCYSSNNYTTWDGKDDAGKVVPDGVYTVHIHAVDSGGGTGDATTRRGVDTRVPGSLITPKSGDTLAGLAKFAFQPTAGYPISQVSVYFDTGGGASIYNSSPDGAWRTNLYTGSLHSGPAVLHTSVFFTDPFGAAHTWTAADTPVVIDVTSLPLTVSADPATGPAPMSTTLHIATSDPQARTVHYTVDFADGSPTAAGDVSDPYTTVDLPHTYPNPGVYRAIVTVGNSAGAASTQAIDITVTGAAVNTAPTAGLNVDTTSGVAPLPVTATVTGSDAESDPLTFTLDFGDGSTAESGALPHDPVTHTYTKAGTYLMRLAVSDGKLTTVKTATVVVALAEPLAANAGDDQVAVVDTAVHFDGSASRPSAGIETYHWVFGDGTTADGAAVNHTYTAPGTYQAQLTVTAGGQSAHDRAVITVKPVPADSGLVVTVTDGNNNPLPAADLVIIDSAGQKYSAVTDAAGSGHLQGLPDGSYTVYGWKDGYQPASATATVTKDAGTATLALKQGQVATASLASASMTYDQIVAAGIDPNDPANQHVYQFSVNLAFDTGGSGSTTASVSGYTATGGFPLCPQVAGISVTCAGSGATFTTGGYTISVSTSYAHGQPQLVWLVIPGKASWLKEFFTVQMMVTNLADPSFVLDHGAATLPLPTGLSLAPTATPQTGTVSMPDIPGGQSATATWLLRGDTEGYYNLASTYAGSLEPFGDTITVNAATASPLHVWGGSALKLSVAVDDKATTGYPFHASVTLQNVADVPVYNAALELLTEGKKNYIYQPREQLAVTAAELRPGASVSHDYILIPTVTGTLDLAKSFVSKSAGDVEVPATITSHPPIVDPANAPNFTITERDQTVGLSWNPVPGATEYEIFSTPSPDQDFLSTPVANVTWLPNGPNGQLKAYVSGLPNGETRYYAISPLVAGQPSMTHPLIPATASNLQSGQQASVMFDDKNGTEHTCGADTVNATFSFGDDFFGIQSYTASVGGSVVAKDANLSQPTATVRVPISVPATGSVTVTAQATNGAGLTGPVISRTVDQDCPVHKAVVVAMGLFSSLSDPATTSDTNPNCTQKPGGDGFNQLAGTNACDNNQPDPEGQGNLVAYLKAKGYDPGSDRNKPNRTLLEFSYRGATVNCQADGGPTFIPNPYSAGDTVTEIADQISIKHTDTAQRYFDAMEQYSDCWKNRYGIKLQYSVIGHSEGGYEALGLVKAAVDQARTDPSRAGLISRVVTVDGAVNPTALLEDLNAGDCFAAGSDWQLPEDVANFYAKLTLPYQGAALVNYLSGPDWAGDIIRNASDSGIRIATVSNALDGCLSLDSTIDYSADTMIWSVNSGTTGSDRHVALLKAHQAPVDEPGYPLARFLDSYLNDGVTSVAPSPQAVGAPRPMGGLHADGVQIPRGNSISVLAASQTDGSINGRLVRPGTTEPVSLGEVLVQGNGVSRSASVQPDGTFAVDALQAGDYKVYVHPLAGCDRGAWVGGSSYESARVITVSGPVDLSDVSGVEAKNLHLALTGPGDSPLTDGVAALVTTDGHVVSYGKTDATGNVTLSAVPGQYRVVAGSLTTQPVEATVDTNTTSDLPLRLNAGASIPVKVTDANGTPIPDVAVALYSGSTVVDAGFTTSDGTYTFVGRDEIPYTVKLYEPLGRFDLSTVSLPVTPVVGDPAAGSVTYKVTPGPIFTSPAPPSVALIGDPFRFTFTASGTPAPTYALASGALPHGLSLGPDGVLAGTPDQTGTFTFSVQATNSAGSATAGPFTITVQAPPNVTSGDPPPGVVGADYHFAFTATGAPAPTFAVTAGALPPGLSLDPVSGVVSGSPTAAGSYTFSVSATNVAGSVTAGPYVLTVSEAPALTSGAPPSADVVGQPYTFTFTATGTPAPTFAVTAGALPGGLSLDAASGVLSGSPTAVGTYTFSISATNVAGSMTGGPYTIMVSSSPPKLLKVASRSLPAAIVGKTYTATLMAVGGVRPYTWSVVAGTLPAGLTLDSASGRITGIPTRVGTATLTFQVMDAGRPAPQSATATLTLRVYRPFILLSPARLPIAKRGQSYTAAINASGGTGPYAFTKIRGDLPPGISLAKSGALTGSPTKDGVYVFAIEATDSYGSTGRRLFILSVT